MKTIGEIEPIPYCSRPLEGSDQIAQFVEEPLVKAVSALHAKNISTRLSSANKYDATTRSGFAFIDFDPGSLTVGNAVTVSELSIGGFEEGQDPFGRVVIILRKRLKVPVTPETTVQEVEESMLALTGLLQPQEPWRGEPLPYFQAQQMLLDRGEEASPYRHKDAIQADFFGGDDGNVPYFYIRPPESTRLIF